MFYYSIYHVCRGNLISGQTMQGCFNRQYNLRDMVAYCFSFSLFCYIVGHLTWAYNMFSLLIVFLFHRTTLMWAHAFACHGIKTDAVKGLSALNVKLEIRLQCCTYFFFLPSRNSSNVVLVFENLWDCVKGIRALLVGHLSVCIFSCMHLWKVHHCCLCQMIFKL